jgi:hypothetical protein
MSDTPRVAAIVAEMRAVASGERPGLCARIHRWADVLQAATVPAHTEAPSDSEWDGYGPNSDGIKARGWGLLDGMRENVVSTSGTWQGQPSLGSDPICGVPHPPTVCGREPGHAPPHIARDVSWKEQA